MNRIIEFLYFKELNCSDYRFCVLLIILPVIITTIPLNPTLRIITLLLILYGVCLLANHLILNISQERYDSLPIDYKYYVCLIVFTLFGILIFLIGLVNNLNETSQYFYLVVVVFAFTIIAYLLCLGIIVKAIITYIYYFALKKFFLNESSTEEPFISRDELSKYITINDQVKFFNTVIVNLVFYFGLVGYMFLWVLTLIKSHEPIIKALVNFAEKYSIASFGNTVGLISLVITIYTVTYSSQNKIYDKAVEMYKEKTGN
ncbi:hypothetical protein [Psychrobacillus sp. FSL K6-1415]|uniref:hypothetical protein n=1 Tax=Psychrobacillus sp. FSL K6-1415 TaxID=2921544 RepID=UPI0030F9C7BC